VTEAQWSLRFYTGVEETLATLDRPVVERIARKLRWLTQFAAVVAIALFGPGSPASTSQESVTGE
jgi:hypothetical protein